MALSACNTFYIYRMAGILDTAKIEIDLIPTVVVVGDGVGSGGYWFKRF